MFSLFILELKINVTVEENLKNKSSLGKDRNPIYRAPFATCSENLCK
jgi:hypothetical protein